MTQSLKNLLIKGFSTLICLFLILRRQGNYVLYLYSCNNFPKNIFTTIELAKFSKELQEMFVQAEIYQTNWLWLLNSL
jgi:hypothetical protein